MNNLRNEFPELFAGIEHHNAASRYGFNWLSVPDVQSNWDVLSPAQQDNFNEFLRGDWGEDLWVHGGLKGGDNRDSTLGEALMLLNGVEIGQIMGGAARHIVRSNIRRNGNYSMERSSRRLLDPRAAKYFAYKKLRSMDLETLQHGKKALHLIISFPGDNGLLHVGNDVLEARDVMNDFFKNGHARLVEWLNSRFVPVEAFVMSCEISCRSIRNSLFYPHIHAVIWVNEFSDFSFLQVERDRGMLLNWRNNDELTTVPRVKGVIGYITQATTLAQVYKREFREDDIQDFNVMTVNAHHALHQLWSGAGGRSMNRKFFSRKVPRL